MKRVDPGLLLQRKCSLVTDQVRGRESANSSTLATSFGLPVEDVQRILRSMGVRDND